MLYIDIGNNEIADSEALEIGAMLELNKSLTELSVQHNIIKAKGSDSIFTALLKNHFLHTLSNTITSYIGNNKIGIKGLKQITEAITKNTTLTRLCTCFT